MSGEASALGRAARALEVGPECGLLPETRHDGLGDAPAGSDIALVVHAADDPTVAEDVPRRPDVLAALRDQLSHHQGPRMADARVAGGVALACLIGRYSRADLQVWTIHVGTIATVLELGWLGRQGRIRLDPLEEVEDLSR